MTPLITDIIIVSILLISGIFAFMRGFIKEVLTIFSLLSAAAGGYIWGPKAVPFFTEIGIDLAGAKDARIWGMVPPEIFGLIAGYGSIFVGLFLILSILSHFIGKMAQDMGLGSTDRTLGFVFGLARGIFILALINIPLLSLLDKNEQPAWLAQARTMVLIDKTSHIILKAQQKPENPLLKSVQKVNKQESKPAEEVVEDKKEGYQQETRDSLDFLIESVE